MVKVERDWEGVAVAAAEMATVALAVVLGAAAEASGLAAAVRALAVQVAEAMEEGALA